MGRLWGTFAMIGCVECGEQDFSTSISLDLEECFDLMEIIHGLFLDTD
jgi:hypothetical protein